MPFANGIFNSAPGAAGQPPFVNYHNLNTTIMRIFSYSEQRGNLLSFQLVRNKLSISQTSQKSIGLFSFLSGIILIIGLCLSFQSTAQTITPSNCVQGCTSNDVQIIKAYLSDANGNRLPNTFVCPGSGSATVNLTLELTTNTPRKGVAIYAKVKQLLPASPPTHPDPYPGDEVQGSPISVCASVVLNQPTNKVIFINAFRWICGTPIALTDVFIGWGTGNESKNFCTSGSFQCPGTPSKCFSLPGDKFIAIETPSAQTTSDAQCATVPGGTTSIFDLTALETTIKNGQTNVNVKWYTDAALTNQISADPLQAPSTKAYQSVSGNVYAKVCSNVSPFPCSAGQTVTLTVKPKPSLSITNPAAVCSPSTVSLTGSGVTTGSSLPTGTSLTYWTNADGTGSVSDAGAVGDGTYYIKASLNGCSDTKSVVATVNPTPSLSITNPAAVCSPSTVSLTAAAVTVGSTLPSGTTLSYWTNSDGTGAVSTPGAVGNGTYYIKAAAGSCSDIKSVVATVNQSPGMPAFTVTQPSLCGPSSTGSITICQSIIGHDYTIGSTTKHGTGSSLTFTSLAAGSNPSLTVVNTSGSCSSGSYTCSDAVADCPTPTARIAAKSTNTITDAAPLQVKAYPNPFNEKINFVVTSPVSGKGSLDVYNSLGQKIRTVYQGNINKGSQNFELRLSQRQVSNLIYVLKVGGQQVSGKILQVNQ
jgi:hypothetical protein